jgi:hypothetical protein
MNASAVAQTVQPPDRFRGCCHATGVLLPTRRTAGMQLGTTFVAMS